MLPKTSAVIVDGKHLETVVFPDSGAKATIVMLHEGLGSVSLWRDFPKRLAAATRCGVVVYSRYGHGASDLPQEPRDVHFMHHEAEVVLPEFLQQMRIERPILLGHSDGGSISLIYAALASANPRGLILEAPHVFVEDLTVASIAKIRDVYDTTDLRVKLGRHHKHVDPMFKAWNDIWLDPSFRNWNIEKLLARVRCPTLVIQGTEDEYGTIAQVEAIRQGVQGAETLLLPECGHAPHRDQPEATLQATQRFVGRILQSA